MIDKFWRNNIWIYDLPKSGVSKVVYEAFKGKIYHKKLDENWDFYDIHRKMDQIRLYSISEN